MRRGSTVDAFAGVIWLQRAIGNSATEKIIRPVSERLVQRVDQGLPYVGALGSYLNPLNQAMRAVLPGLDDRQKALLDGIFGNALSTSIIRLNANSMIGFGGCYRTTGNIINMPGTDIEDKYLVHEAAHVWQHQNGIPFGYAISSLSSMAVAEIFTGDWEKSYEYDRVEKYHVPWNYWNAEQQASWIADHSALPPGWAWASLPDWLLPGGQFHPDMPL
jgi:hypothetical protein